MVNVSDCSSAVLFFSGDRTKPTERQHLPQVDLLRARTSLRVAPSESETETHRVLSFVVVKRKEGVRPCCSGSARPRHAA